MSFPHPQRLRTEMWNPRAMEASSESQEATDLPVWSWKINRSFIRRYQHGEIYRSVKNGLLNDGRMVVFNLM